MAVFFVSQIRSFHISCWKWGKPCITSPQLFPLSENLLEAPDNLSCKVFGSPSVNGVYPPLTLAESSLQKSESDAESGWSGVSDNSCMDSECTILEASSVASDQNRSNTAYEAFRNLADGLCTIDLTRYQECNQ